MELNLISIITCINDQEVYEKYLHKSLIDTSTFIKDTSTLENLDVICVLGKDYSSLSHAYNAAQKKAKYKIKVFVHEDIDLLEPNWVTKLLNIFENLTTGLVGLIGTPTMYNTNFFWWHNDYDNYEGIYGKQYLSLDKIIYFKEVSLLKEEEDIECIDGGFLATNLDYLPFDEDLVINPNHFMPLYEQDICNYIRIEKKLKVKLLDHLTWHVGGNKDMDFLRTQTDEVVEKYKTKWNID